MAETDIVEQAVIITGGPDWLIGMPAIYSHKSDCIQPARIAPWHWYTATDIAWRPIQECEVSLCCGRCGGATHMLCGKAGKYCRSCARLSA
jgi:hypothetical protein